MFNFLVTASLQEPALRPRGRARAGRLRRLRAAARAGGRVPGPQPAHRHPDDRGRGPRAAGGRAARHLPDRDRDERHAGRARACARSRASASPSSTSSSTGARTSTASRQLVAERLALVRRAAARAASRPQMGPVTSIMGEIMLIAVTSDDASRPWRCARSPTSCIRPQLLTIPGVAQVIPIGGEVRQYRVVPERRRHAGARRHATSRSRRRSRASAPTPAAASSTSTGAST